jgi:site-specific DNA-cytosine methylase
MGGKEVNGKIILDLCGGTGSWSKPYKDAGYDVRTITLPKDDVRTYVPPERVWGVLAAPPCTEFSYAKHYHGKGNYTHDFAAGLAVADACLRIAGRTNPAWWALENPRGYLKRWYGEPRLTFDPWEYGDPYQKKTCLWGVFNIPSPTVREKPAKMLKFSLLKSKDIRPEVFGKFTRTERRAMTPAGFAQTFFEANQ